MDDVEDAHRGFVLEDDNGKDGRLPGNQTRHHERWMSQDAIGEAEEHKNLVYHSDDEPISNRSSISTGGDVELDHLASEDGLTDDEETGLTKNDKRKRKRRRRKDSLLEERIAVHGKATKEERIVADMSVLKKSLVNAILIGLWSVPFKCSTRIAPDVVPRYLFSLSISIVSPSRASCASRHKAD